MGWRRKHILKSYRIRTADMGSLSKIVAGLPPEPFVDAEFAVNEWRGRCLHSFSCAETAVTECLLVLSKVPGRGEKVQLRHMMGQRYEDLASAISPEGPFNEEGGS